MKTFKQFSEQSKNDVPDVIKSLQGIAQTAGNTIDPKKVRNQVIGTVFDKLTGGEKGRENAINAAGKKVEKMGTDLPMAFDNFNTFLQSGKLEANIGKLGKKFGNMK